MYRASLQATANRTIHATFLARGAVVGGEPSLRPGVGVGALPAGRSRIGGGSGASAAIQLPERTLDVHAVANACDAQLHEVVLGERRQVCAFDLMVLEAVSVLA